MIHKTSRSDADEDIAFVGGIDLAPGRGDHADHHGDPQPVNLGDERYGDTPPWHDIQLSLRGPAVADVAWTFRERWEDPTPLDRRNPRARPRCTGAPAKHLGRPEPATP